MSSSLPADLAAAARLGGEMGARFATFDWASHPLGAPDGWPAEVRAAVSMALASRFPTVLWIGPQLHLIYNDAYIPALSEKHPGALGRTGREVWAEIWDVIGPMLAGVVSTGRATWSHDLLLMLTTGGRPRERFFTFTYSPILAADGSVSGVFCAVTETTERVLGERRLRLLNHLAGAVLDAGTIQQTLNAAIKACESNPADLPFVAAYLSEPDAKSEPLAAACSSAEGKLRTAAPTSDFWATAPGPAPAGETVVDLDGRLQELGAVFDGAAPEQALVLPLADPGTGAGLGRLVVGLSPHLPLDEQYMAFCRLLGDQISAALLKARAYEDERRRAERLAELDRAKTAFFTGVSHEFRTPLTLIMGPVEDLLANGSGLVQPHREALETVQGNAERLLRLVNSLLDFSRLESGRASGRYSPVDLAEYTAEVASMFRSAIERAGLAFHVDAPPLPEAVYVDTDHWAKIVLNLLSNALKFTFEGSITVALRAVSDGVELSVSDTGVGIPDYEQPRLFERFHRVDGIHARTHEGSGIGLALVAELAHLHGGAVSVDSTPGAGSTFFVRVPFGAEHLPQEQVVPAAGEGDIPPSELYRGYVSEATSWLDTVADAEADDGSAGADDRPRILVVDDNADLRHYMARLLSTDYTVFVARDGVEGLARARRDRPDLVLTDVMMPGLDGFNLLRELHSDPATAGIPVVVVSARAGEEGIVEGLEAGADDYLIKPFGARELLARVAANLELERNRRTRAQLEEAQRLAQIGSWEIDLSDMSVRGSTEYFRILAADPERLRRGGIESALGFVHADDVERARAAVEAATGGEPLDIEIRVLTAAGEVRTVRVRGSLHAGTGGHPGHVRGTLQDVTSQRQAEAAQAAAAAANEAAAREHAIASQLQHSLLPPTESAPDALEVATYYRAGVEGTQVGGDWYDVIELSSGRTALVVGDVMGRGVSAAALMGQLRTTVRAYARLDLPPAELISLCDQVVSDLGGERLVTAIYGVYDPATNIFSYANAGHLPPLVVLPDNSITRGRGADRPPLGAGGPAPSEQQLALPPGSTLALFTDGLVERRGGDLDAGLERLGRLLARADVPTELLTDQVVAGLADDEPDDDVALLVARTPAGARDILVWQVPPEPRAVADMRRLLASTLSDWVVGAEPADRIVLLACELVTNALVYGRAPIELRVRKASGKAVLEVHDHTRVLPHLQSPTDQDEGGRGLQLVQALAQRWGTRPTGTGKWVWCEVSL